MDYFEVGAGYFPEWLWEKVMCFLRADGSVGYELHRKNKSPIAIEKGDTVCRDYNGEVKLFRARRD